MSTNISFRSHEPFRHERVWIVPCCWISTYSPYIDENLCSSRHSESTNFNVRSCFSRK
ncbi:hypothetical protein LINPERHAP2_LOCUS24314 [Linum perenne]